MELDRVLAAGYSPCGSTMEVVRAVASGTGLALDEADLTRGSLPVEASPHDLVVLGSPTYGGRVPEAAERQAARLRGLFSPAVLVAAYGDRGAGGAVDDLARAARGLGLVPVAAVLAPCEHVMVPALGAGRPSPSDLDRLAGFGARVRALLDGSAGPFDAGPVPDAPAEGPMDHLELGFGARCDPDLCVGCTACAHACPNGCIPMDEPYLTDPSRCDGCMACIRECPVGARTLDDEPRREAMVRAYTAVAGPPHAPVLLLPDGGLPT